MKNILVYMAIILSVSGRCEATNNDFDGRPTFKKVAISLLLLTPVVFADTLEFKGNLTAKYPIWSVNNTRLEPAFINDTNKTQFFFNRTDDSEDFSFDIKGNMNTFAMYLDKNETLNPNYISELDITRYQRRGKFSGSSSSNLGTDPGFYFGGWTGGMVGTFIGLIPTFISCCKKPSKGQYVNTTELQSLIANADEIEPLNVENAKILLEKKGYSLVPNKENPSD